MFDYEKLMPRARSIVVSLSLSFSLHLTLSFSVSVSQSLSFSLPFYLTLHRCACLQNSFNGIFSWPQLSFDCLPGQGQQQKLWGKAGQEEGRQAGKGTLKIDGALIERKCAR